MNFPEYLIKWGLTGLIWSAWCVLHSILNSEGLIRGSGLLDSAIGRYYRLIYSIVAVITLWIAFWITPKWHEFELWRFQGLGLLIPVLVWASAVVMFYLTFRFFNIWHFLGLTSLGIGRKSRRLSEETNNLGHLRCNKTSTICRDPHDVVGQKSHRYRLDYKYRALRLPDSGGEN